MHLRYTDPAGTILLALDNAPPAMLPHPSWEVRLQTDDGPEVWHVASVVQHVCVSTLPRGAATRYQVAVSPWVEVRLHRVGAVACQTTEDAT